jgi:DNA polymerase-3 subunit gamma/tau
MAKKKSKRFIIPSIHFLTTHPVAKIQEAVAVKPNRPEPGPPAAFKKPAEKTKSAPPEPVKAPAAPKPMKPQPLQPSARRNSALSLSSLKRKKEEEAKARSREAAQVAPKDLPKDPFTKEVFIKVWTAYVESLHDKGEKILASILKADAPGLKGHLIQLTYPNEMMKLELLKVRPKVLKHIRKALNNYSIDFEITVNEDTTKRFAYTPQEKYELLKEKNKDISLLRKTFNLDL